MSDVEQNLLNAITAYIDEQRGIESNTPKQITPDTITIMANMITIRAILTLRLMEQGRLKLPLE